ncbi:MAG: protease modulator HflC [Rickettsiales bacterium]|nr:protease modulator HflC [Rickettsiales bacterium]
MKKTPFLIGILAVGAFALMQAAFIVHQTEQVLVLQFGKPIRSIQEPGLYFKTPFIQDLTRYDKRILEFNAKPEEINMVDEKRGIQERVVVDAFVKYVIVDPLLFYQSVRNERNLNEQLRSIVFSSVREVLGKKGLRDLLSDQRVQIMLDIRKEVNRRLLRSARETVESLAAAAVDGFVKEEVARRGFGIDVVDVRINRADLPEEISLSTFNRMRANFAEEAQKFRSQGQEESLKVKSTAEREQAEIMADANQKAQTIRGEGEGIATKIYAEAFEQDASFFEFYRALQAYETSIDSDDTTMILSPDSDFLKYLGN